MSGCCPFPREPAQTRVHIHTHGRCRRPHQASVCPHSHLLPRPPGFQARSSHGLSHPRSLPPLPQSWSPAPPGCSGPSPGRPGRVGASCGGPAAVGGQRRLVPLHQPSTGQCQGRRAWLSARLAPQSAVLQNRGSPECFWERSVSKHKERSSCVLRKSHVLFSGVLVSTSVICPSVPPFVYLLRPIPGETRWEKGGGKSKKEGGKEKKLEGGKVKLAPGAAHRPGRGHRRLCREEGSRMAPKARQRK